MRKIALVLAAASLAGLAPLASTATATGGPASGPALKARTYFFNIRQGWLVKPERLDFCSSGCEYDSLKWRGWHSDRAVGSGDFAPVISGEVEGRWPVKVVMFAPRRCRNGRRIYTKLTITFTADRPSGMRRSETSRWDCSGFFA